MAPVRIIVNGKVTAVDAAPETPLLWVLRDTLGLTGTKYSCGAGLCGACTVLLDGEPTRACQITTAQAANRHVTTIEGLSTKRSHVLQRAWLEEQVPQCGYCQPGQILSAAALLAKTPHPTDAEIDRAMSANLCRCGTYPRIRRAIHRAARGAAR